MVNRKRGSGPKDDIDVGPTVPRPPKRRKSAQTDVTGAPIASTSTARGPALESIFDVDNDEAENDTEKLRRRKAKGKARAADPDDSALARSPYFAPDGPTAESKDEDAAETIKRLQAELERKSALAQGQQELIDRLKSSLNCSVCLDTLQRPMTMSCGHSACRSCLVAWFNGRRDAPAADGDEGERGKRPVCPQCRNPVIDPPQPIYALREAADTMRSAERAGGVAADPSAAGPSTVAPGSDRTSPSKAARDAELAGDPTWGGLFPHAATKGTKGRGRFENVRHQGINDAEDNVRRCWNCGWEIEDGECFHCGEIYESQTDESDGDGDSQSSGLNHAAAPRATSSEIEAANAGRRNGAPAAQPRARARARRHIDVMDSDDSDDEERDLPPDDAGTADEMADFITSDKDEDEEVESPPRRPRTAERPRPPQAPIAISSKSSSSDDDDSDAEIVARIGSGQLATLRAMQNRFAAGPTRAFGDEYNSAEDSDFRSIDAVDIDVDPEIDEDGFDIQEIDVPPAAADDAESVSETSSGSEDEAPVIPPRQAAAAAAEARARAAAAAASAPSTTAHRGRRIVIDSDDE